MNRIFFEINCAMKQLYFANRQWFQVRERFAHLSASEQRQWFDLMLQIQAPLYELQRLMAQMQHVSDDPTDHGAAPSQP